ncbi:MAG TPA: PQQ-binding-like beta-propeller repeat protein [Chthoniobacteraceae bacterium]|nr:PQQ-binding-like beta-propeller repeat protein [Chthoniobacteraceae bacterium]
MSALTGRAEDSPQWRGLNRDGVWNEEGILETFPPGGLNIRWRAPVSLGYSNPIVADGRVYVTDVVLGPKEAARAVERVHCFNEASGRVVWISSYDATYPDFAWPPQSDYGGPVATPIVHRGKLYAAGGVGNLVCLDAFTGRILWSRDLAKEYGIGGDFVRCGSPLIEGTLLIVQVNSNKPKAGVVAFDKDSGKEVWKALESGNYFSSPVVIQAGGKRQLIVSCGGWVTSLAPATGDTYWREPLLAGRPIPSPVSHKNRLLVNGLMLDLAPDQPAASVLWPLRKPDAFLSDTTTAIHRDDLIVSHKRGGLLVGLDANTGKELWSTDQAKSSMHSLTLCGTGVFVFTDKGEMIRIQFTAQGYRETGRTALIKPTTKDGEEKLVYAAPAYANRHVFARNDEELICASLAAKP